MEPTHNRAPLMEVLKPWVKGGHPDFDAARIAELVEPVQRNRLEPLMGHFPGLPMTGTWEAVSERWKRSYHQNLLRNLDLLRAGEELMGLLAGKDIPALAVRGVFSAGALYGDVGARYTGDLDLLVPSADREQALRVAVESGYGLQNPYMPRGFYRRHHLHWPLYHADRGIRCDLHWALDHPYTLTSIDYADLFATAVKREADGFTWREPDPENLFLCTCLHLAKHAGEQLGREAAEPEYMCERGGLAHWLDAGRIASCYGEAMDWTRVEAKAAEWHLGVRAERVIAGLCHVFNMPLDVPRTTSPGVASAGLIKAPKWVARAGCFRGSVLTDAWSYIWPARSYFAHGGAPASFARRVKHAAKGIMRMGWAGIDVLCCSTYALIHKWISGSKRQVT